MICGATIHCELTHFEDWRRNTQIPLIVPINAETGQVVSKTISIKNGIQNTITYSAKIGEYKLRVKEVKRFITGHDPVTTHYLIINGSLHANHFQGENYSFFYWKNLQMEIDHLQKKLQLSLNKCRLLGFEFGVNLPVEFDPFDFLQKHLLLFKAKSFDSLVYDEQGKCLGFQCINSQYLIKIYDKSLQYHLPYNLMRFELHLKKMQKIQKAGIQMLSDLTIKEKVARLLPVLLKAWDEILIYEPMFESFLQEIKHNKGDWLSKVRYPQYWIELKKENPRKFRRIRSRYRDITNKTELNTHNIIKKRIELNWSQLISDDPVPRLVLN